MTPSLAETSWRVMARHGKTFAWAARALPRDVRDDAACLYAFARTADDLVDVPTLGSAAERRARLQQLCAQIGHADATDLQVAAVNAVLARWSIPVPVVQHFLDALASDFEPARLASFAELIRYAHGVAGCVGLMMRPMLGAGPQAASAAAALGIAMQITNIVRDVEEDWNLNRVYVPADWLRAPLPDQLPPGRAREWVDFDALLRLLAHAEDFYRVGMEGIDALHPEGRRAIRTAATLYREIGRQIAAAGPERYWGRRTVVSRWRRLALTLGWVQPHARVAASSPQRPAATPLELLACMQPALPGL